MRTRGIGPTEPSRPLTAGWLRRLATAVLAVGVATVGIAVVSASPAQAVPGVKTASGSTNSDLTPLKQVSAVCPAGTRVYGGGASIQTGFGNVVITGIVPNQELTRVTATAIQRIAVTTPWTLIARAICGPPTAGLVRVPVSATGSPPSSVTVTCPASTNLFGMGMAINNSVSDSTSAATLTRMAPVGATQATLAAAETRAFAGQWTLVGYGICAAPVATRTVISGLSTSTSDSPQQASASCALGTAVHGLGMEVLPGAGVAASDLILNSISTAGGATTASSVMIYERGAIAGLHRVRTLGVCAS